MSSRLGQQSSSSDDGSMDTILASIRRILNEDEVAPAESAPELRPSRNAAPEAGPASEDVLVLGESMMVPAGEPSSEPPAAAKPVVSPSHTSPQDLAAIESLVAAHTRAAAAQSFDALQQAMKQKQPASAPAISSPMVLRTGGPTLEDLVRAELRTLLSDWLDLHLPGLVETLVKQEIEKLTRRF